MYLSYYNLKHKPFQISSDPGFLWLGEKHMEALATLRYGVLDNKGFLLLTGDVGTGKTTLINALLKTLGDNVLVATIRDPDLTPTDFFQYTAHVFGLKREITSKVSFLIHFEKFLVDAFEHDKKVLLIIDEAQRINQKLLEEVRLLSNIEKNECKLLNIFFVGQIEFNDILLRPVNRPIRQRITVNYNIESLSEQETEQYIRHRLAIARQDNPPQFFTPGHEGDLAAILQEKPQATAQSLFSDGAIREIFLFSKGYPRLINIICDRCLLTGYVEDARAILPKHVRECAKELEIPYFGLKQNRDWEEADESAVQQKTAAPPMRNRRPPAPAARPAIPESEEESHLPIEKLDMQIPVTPTLTPGAMHTPPPMQPVKPAKRKKKKGRIAMAYACLFLLLLLIGYLSVSSDPVLSTRIPDILKKENILESSTRLWQSVEDFFSTETRDDFSKMFASFFMPNTAEERLSGGTSAVVASPRPMVPEEEEKPSTTGPLLGKLIMPFPPDATLPPSTSLVNLNMLIESIPSQDTYKVIISGFTDGEQDETLNQALSQAKANAIKIYLISLGLEEGQIETQGLGSQNPIAPNTTAPGREANHRVEVVFRRI